MNRQYSGGDRCGK